MTSFFAALSAILAAISAIYIKGKSDGKAKVENEAAKDALRRTENALSAGDAITRNADGLRDNDGFRRD